MLGVGRVLIPYLISKIKKIQNGGHLAKILDENITNGKIAIVGSKIYEIYIK